MILYSAEFPGRMKSKRRLFTRYGFTDDEYERTIASDLTDYMDARVSVTAVRSLLLYIGGLK